MNNNTYYTLDTDYTSNYTTEELDSRVMKGEFVLQSIGFGYECIGDDPKLPGGWKAKWINSQGMGNHGQLVILPSDDRTGKIYGYALEEKGRQAGLEHDTASVWASAEIGYKHELLEKIVETIKNEKLILAYLAYPGFGPGRNRDKWKKEFNISNELSAPREKSLASMIMAFYEKGCFNIDILSTIDHVKSSFS
ncbi:MAG: hypothetical protein GY828_05895, partial [Candidatus Gracilibacteria bacterium]|nr:hypothetical protein [Candidatus Gracilibacteria bacterium]